MAITAPYSGTATIGTTETSLVSGTTTLQTATVPGIYQACVDLSALTTADLFEMTIYEAATSGGTKRVAWRRRFGGPLPEPIVITPSLLLMHGWDMTLDKVLGTDRSISWSIRQVG